MRTDTVQAVALLALATALGADPVRIESGLVSGVAADGVVAWKGIAYAAPPMGKLRWRGPQPARAWDDVRKADAYAHDCMQEPFLIVNPDPRKIRLNLIERAADAPH